MFEITFEVEQNEDDGGYSAAWPDPNVGGIATSGDSLTELEAMIKEAVQLYFEGRTMPLRVKLHFLADPQVPLESSAQAAAYC